MNQIGPSELKWAQNWLKWAQNWLRLAQNWLRLAQNWLKIGSIKLEVHKKLAVIKQTADAL